MYQNLGNLWPRGTAPAQAFCGEDQRMSVLAAFGVQGMVDDPELQNIVTFAARLCDTPIALVSLVERDRQLFVARLGLVESETPRPTSFCAHAMLEPDTMIVADARLDPRFVDNPLVTGPPGIRFYAGVPLISSEGAPLGSLCVIDTEPRETGLSDLEREGLELLATSVMQRLSAERQERATLEMLENRERELRLMLDSVPGIALSADGMGDFVHFNARWKEFTGKQQPRSVDDWEAVVHPDDYSAARALWDEVFRKGEQFSSEFRVRRADGEYRWMLARVVPVEVSEGRKRWFGTVIDNDDARRVSELRELLAHELSHRIKNIFAVVSGLIALRARGRPEAKEFAEELTATIRSLGTAHDYVRPDTVKEQGALQELLYDLMRPYDTGDGRIAISGDNIAIGARAATPLALIFHELATNAAKYGALGEASGKVSIRIATPDTDEGEVCFFWQESSSRYAGAPDEEGEGFGSRLLRMAVESQLRGRFNRTYSSDGLDVEIAVPLDQLTR